MYFFSHIFLFILFQINNISTNDIRNDCTDLDYETLLNWSLKEKSFHINNKIKLTVYNEEENQYIAKEDISKDEILLDIPQELTITVDRTLSILNSTELKNKYNSYIKEVYKNKNTLKDISYIDQSFLAFLFYKINKTQSNFSNNFYDYYKYLNFIFEDDLSHLPFMFNEEQINLFINSSFGSNFQLLSLSYKSEYEILQKLFNEEIDLDKYFQYRFILAQKSNNISNTTSIVPFVDYIKRDFDSINCQLSIKNKHIILKSIKNIKKGEILIQRPKKNNNQYNFMIYGKTYQKLLNKINSFIIPIVNPSFLMDENINIEISGGEENQGDLVWKGFFQLILPTYKEIAQSLKRDDSNYACYSLILKYINQIRESYNKAFDFDDIEDAFDEEIDSENIIRIIKGEMNFLDLKIKELKNIMEKEAKKENKKKIKKENIEDL
jgi:hypothetical protein